MHSHVVFAPELYEAKPALAILHICLVTLLVELGDEEYEPTQLD